MLNNYAVLILNGSYEPIAIASVKRAIKLLVKERAVVEEKRDREIYPGFFMPSVIRLKTYRHIPIRTSIVTRKNIYQRDNYTCQYCGEYNTGRGLTLDHIVPESRGGKSSFENLVACCVSCNRRKADKTPEEAGLQLLHKPRPVTIHTGKHILRSNGLHEKSWHKYIYC